MTWFKVDDGYHSHPKVMDLDMAARGLWVTAGSYCARYLTDGVITDKQIRAIGGTRKQAEKLVAAGLWSADDAPPSARRYSFEHWSEFQPTRRDVESKRQEARDRMAEARAKKRATRDNAEMFARTIRERSQEVRSSGLSERSHYPDPTRPDPTIGGEVGDQPHYRATARRDSPSEIPPVWLAASAADPRPDWVRGTPDDPRCPTHEHLAPDAVPACTRCRRARDWLEAHDATVAEAERQARRHARDTCPVCHGDTIITLPDERGWRCPHDGTTPPKTNEKGAQSDEHDASVHSPQPDTPIRPTGTGGPF